jgi:DNA-damage-inducible protein J
MAKTTELKIRIDPELKASVSKLYGTWGLNISDAVTIFFNQSLRAGGLPFAMRLNDKPFALNEGSSRIVPVDKTTGHTVLPADWDDPEDGIYDKL